MPILYVMVMLVQLKKLLVNKQPGHTSTLATTGLVAQNHFQDTLAIYYIWYIKCLCKDYTLSKVS